MITFDTVLVVLCGFLLGIMLGREINSNPVACTHQESDHLIICVNDLCDMADMMQYLLPPPTAPKVKPVYKHRGKQHASQKSRSNRRKAQR